MRSVESRRWEGFPMVKAAFGDKLRADEFPRDPRFSETEQYFRDLLVVLERFGADLVNQPQARIQPLMEELKQVLNGCDHFKRFHESAAKELHTAQHDIVCRLLGELDIRSKKRISDDRHV